MILGLDMAMVTGWAFLDTSNPERIRSSGTFRTKKDVPLGRRLSVWMAQLEEFMSLGVPDAVVYEVAHFRGGWATRSGVGMESVMLMVCDKYGVPVVGVHSLSLKKWATGSGKASKEEMLAVAKSNVSYSVTDDNEADAICLALWGGENVAKDGTIIEKRIPTKSKRRKK